LYLGSFRLRSTATLAANASPARTRPCRVSQNAPFSYQLSSLNSQPLRDFAVRVSQFLLVTSDNAVVAGVSPAFQLSVFSVSVFAVSDADKV
jgi:hypothetical protein